jgi:phytoene dehydrogenase-like protein
MFAKVFETLGLASAIALKRSGHNVLVLEKEQQLGGTDSVSFNFIPWILISAYRFDARYPVDVLG